MSDKHPFETAYAVALDIKKRLKPFCELIEIAGSLRRMKPEVSDIEVVYVPRIESRQADFFSQEPFDLANEEIGKMLIAGVIAKRPNERGVFAFGKLNKLCIHLASGINLDLFCEPDIQDWPRSLAIRTGSAEFNIELMSSAPRHGHNAHAYGHALTKIPGGERVIATDERNFIELCGVKFIDPKDR